MPSSPARHGLRTSGRLSLLALISYASFVVYQTVAGGGTWACGGQALALDARLSRTDLLANVVAYVPLGLLGIMVASARSGSMPASPSRRLASAALVTAGACALSLVLEVAQSCQSARVSSPFDWAANTLGAATGTLLGLLVTSRAVWRPLSPGTTPDVMHGRLRALTIAVALGWVVLQTKPWIFAVDVGTLRSNLSFLRRWEGLSTFDMWTVMRHAAAWLAIASAWRLAASTPRAAAVATMVTAVASVALQLFLDARSPLSFDEGLGLVLGAAVVALLWAVGVPATARRQWSLLLLLAATAAVAAYQLRPEPGETVQAFNWWPQVGMGGLGGALDYALLFGWFGAAVTIAGEWRHQAGDERARRYWPVTAILAMLVLEAMQTGIPGRGPDVSAPLFTALAVVTTLALLGRR